MEVQPHGENFRTRDRFIIADLAFLVWPTP
jgi:hypothetical protein